MPLYPNTIAQKKWKQCNPQPTLPDGQTTKLASNKHTIYPSSSETDKLFGIPRSRTTYMLRDCRPICTCLCVVRIHYTHMR